mgnify:CR=1 FL=1
MSAPGKVKKKNTKDDFEKQFDSDTEDEFEHEVLVEVDSDHDFEYCQDTEDEDSDLSDVESCCSEQSSTSIKSNVSIRKKYIDHLVEEEVSD